MFHDDHLLTQNAKLMSADIPKEEYEQIEKMIASDESVVGIDAKKTHIIIIQKLMELEKRLGRIEQKMASE